VRIALLTDFGTRDPYVASMKGVIASRTGATIHDLTHEIEPFDVFGAAWFLKTVEPWWPDTIFVCVVDPGVGTARRIVALEEDGQDGRLFLAPDNGLLTMVAGSGRIVSVENETLFLPAGSTTFHGRDRFAPVAAALAEGLPVSDLGPEIEEMVRLEYTPPSYDASPIEGTIVSVDRFGNCITDLEAARLGAVPSLRAGAHVIHRVSTTYEGEGPFIIIGSTGHLEISIAGGNAAEALRLRRGEGVFCGVPGPGCRVPQSSG
jgi:S-adenosylmethionine hydrolase